MPKNNWPSARGCSAHSLAQRRVRSTAARSLAGRAGVGRAIVEDHRDIRAERALDGHRFFGAEEQQRAVQVRTEFDAMGLDFANGGQAEDLEPAAVGQDGRRPIDKAVEAAGGADDVQARADVEVVGVAENDLAAHLAQLARVNRLDAALGAHRHEYRRINHTVRCRQPPQARPGRSVCLEQVKHAVSLSESNNATCNFGRQIRSGIFSGRDADHPRPPLPGPLLQRRRGRSPASVAKEGT